MSKEDVVKEGAGPRTRVNFWVSKKIYAEIENIANRDDRTVSEVVRDALRKLINEDKKENGVADGGGNS